jgi:hypothetical protein
MGLIRLIYLFIYETQLYREQPDFVRNRPKAVVSIHLRETPVFRPFFIPNVQRSTNENSSDVNLNNVDRQITTVVSKDRSAFSELGFKKCSPSNSSLYPICV